MHYMAYMCLKCVCSFCKFICRWQHVSSRNNGAGVKLKPKENAIIPQSFNLLAVHFVHCRVALFKNYQIYIF